jgi:tetratricopeptide (TPR) repeat protein
MSRYHFTVVLLAIGCFALIPLVARAQTPAAPEKPADCLKAARDYANERMKAAGSTLTGALAKEINEKKATLARECASRFSIASTPAQDLPALAELFAEAGQFELADAAIEKNLALTKLDEAGHAKALASAIQVLRRQPKSDARNARLERYCDALDQLSDAVIENKISGHVSLNSYYRADDIDSGIIKHSTWLIEAAGRLTPEQRKKFGNSFINAYVNLAEAYAGQEQNDRALELLRRAAVELKDLPNVEAQVRPALERYLLVGTPAPPIEAPRWINASPAGMTTLDLKGKVTLLEFTAHWCGPCRESYPGLHRLLKRFANRDFQIVLVTELYGYFGGEHNLSPEQELEKDRAYFAGEHGFDVKIAVGDAARTTREAGKVVRHRNPNELYKVHGIPQIHIIDRQGIHRLIMVGYDDANEEKLAGLIERLLGPTRTSDKR